MGYDFVNPPRIGIVGGGQLAKMITLAAREYNCDVVILERSRNSPSENLAADVYMVIGMTQKNYWNLRVKLMLLH